MSYKTQLKLAVLILIGLVFSSCKALELFKVENSSGILLFWQISIVFMLVAGLFFYKNYKLIYTYCDLVENRAKLADIKAAKQQANQALLYNSILVVIAGLGFAVPMLFSGPNLMLIPFLILMVYMHFYNKSLKAFRTTQPKPLNDNMPPLNNN